MTFSLNKPNVLTFVVNLTKTKHFNVLVASSLCKKKKINKSHLGYKNDEDKGLEKVCDTIKGILQTIVDVYMDDGNINRSFHRCLLVVSIFSKPNTILLSSLRETLFFLSPKLHTHVRDNII